MSLTTYCCPICGLDEKGCRHTKEEMWEFQNEQEDTRREALDIIRQIIRVDKLQDMPVVPEWIDLVQKAREFLKNNA